MESFSYDGKERQKLVRIYNFWQHTNKPHHAKFVTNLCLFVTIMMIFFDYLFVKDPIPFIRVRLIKLLVLAVNYWLLHTIATDLKKNIFHNTLNNIALTIPLYAFNLSYFYLVFVLKHEKFSVYYTGLLLVVFFTSFVYNRFVKLQYVYNFASILISAFFLYLSFSDVTVRDYCYIVIIVSLSSAFVAVYFRREFVGNLYAKYKLLHAMVPHKIAEYLTITNDHISTSSVFKPEERFTVCLCADWRNFQSLCVNKTNTEITQMLEKYYEAVIKVLENVIPDHNYYMSWTADELFIVFFNEGDHREKVINDALNFTKLLATEVHQSVQNDISSDIEFDIGISAGLGLLGLQGPRQQKKTTITGEVAGRAKRLETEAKTIRAANNFVYPSIVIDEALYHFAITFGFADKKSFTSIIAKTKDVTNQRFYTWNITPNQARKLKIA